MRRKVHVPCVCFNKTLIEIHSSASSSWADYFSKHSVHVFQDIFHDRLSIFVNCINLALALNVNMLEFLSQNCFLDATWEFMSMTFSNLISISHNIKLTYQRTKTSSWSFQIWVQFSYGHSACKTTGIPESHKAQDHDQIVQIILKLKNAISCRDFLVRNQDFLQFNLHIEGAPWASCKLCLLSITYT